MHVCVCVCVCVCVLAPEFGLKTWTSARAVMKPMVFYIMANGRQTRMPQNNGARGAVAEFVEIRLYMLVLFLLHLPSLLEREGEGETDRQESWADLAGINSEGLSNVERELDGSSLSKFKGTNREAILSERESWANLA